MIIVEGYRLRDCSCSPDASLEFVETQVFNQPRFMVTCRNCGNSTHGFKNKEQAVHRWNQSATALLG